MKSLFLTGTLGVSLLVIAGCATTQSSHTSSPRPVIGGQTYYGQPRDKVLWAYRNALTAMRQGNYPQAKELLDDAILSMGGIITNDKAARQARSLFHGEAKKTFIGEPYERVMAYYYRGILYWMDGEPDNARACFRSAMFIDSDVENKAYAADYTLLEYLDGLASVKMSGDGSDALQRARKFSAASLPDYNSRANVLVFIEAGDGPMKYAAGEYRETLLFSQGKTGARSATVRVNGQTIPAPAYDDLYYQATTRGGRVMDQILANKAGFKATTDTIGDASIISGAVLAGTQQGRGSKADEVGFGLLAFGVLNKIVSSATTPTADTRYWDNLPQYLSFAALELPPGEHTLIVEFQGQRGQNLPNLTKTISVNVPTDRDAVIFISDKSIPKST
ncbi:MAG: hypothetical protein H0X66_07220 [Verrucomicrobia bacterium]|nr:hypothetical protein [Verrucomicrobiota bacterium]